jgi:hypothetical protein
VVLLLLAIKSKLAQMAQPSLLFSIVYINSGINQHISGNKKPALGGLELTNDLPFV